MSSVPDRRLEPRLPARLRGLLVAPGLELGCLIVDQSSAGLKVRLDRNLALPQTLMIVDMDQGLAISVERAWQKGLDAGLKRTGVAGSLKGLVPSRLMPARDAWKRAGGR